jgi:hypothetical protein
VTEVLVLFLENPGSTVRRLEYVHEQRNPGASRRMYRPMMSVVDML